MNRARDNRTKLINTQGQEYGPVSHSVRRFDSICCRHTRTLLVLFPFIVGRYNENVASSEHQSPNGFGFHSEKYRTRSVTACSRGLWRRRWFRINGGGTTNRAPIANAGIDQTVAEQSSVTLDGTGSRDPDGDNLTYTWTQTVGTTVSITNGNMPTASFDAPAAGETLTFQLAVNDGTTTVVDTVDVTIQVALPAVTVSGKVFYEFVPPNANCNGLNFSATQTRPIRAATVQLLDAGSNVLATTVAAPPTATTPSLTSPQTSTCVCAYALNSNARALRAGMSKSVITSTRHPTRRRSAAGHCMLSTAPSSTPVAPTSPAI